MNHLPVRKIVWAIVTLCFLSSYVVSYADDNVTVTITNETQYYVHILINNATYLYVAPGGYASTETPLSTAYVEVFYSPGQGVSGRAVKQLESTVTNTTDYSNSSSSTCNSTQSHSDCSTSTDDQTTNSYSRSPMSWGVTSLDLSADSTSN